MPCGVASVGAAVAYFYPAYFAVLLVHREMRDSDKCAKKYGAAWEEYKRAVPWRIVPGVY
jgi:delta14-sterol reductase